MAAIRFPWENNEAPARDPAPPPAPKPRGRRPAARTRPAPAETAAAADWLYHRLTITGPAAPVAEFAEAARGSGVIPWRLDFARLEEDVFNLAVSQPAQRRSLSIQGCHILARQFRDRVEAQQAKAAALVGRSRACPFDLHALLPVPAAILCLGPADPAALAWLSAHWGTTDRLRQVVERPGPGPGRRLPRGHAAIGYGFFTAGTTPHAAIARLGASWPAAAFRPAAAAFRLRRAGPPPARITASPAAHRSACRRRTTA